jgi:hypothetical protein
MTVAVEAQWKKAADVAWGGAACVAGSLPQKKREVTRAAARPHAKRSQLSKRSAKISESDLSAGRLAMLGKKVPQ